MGLHEMRSSSSAAPPSRTSVRTWSGLGSGSGLGLGFGLGLKSGLGLGFGFGFGLGERAHHLRVELVVGEPELAHAAEAVRVAHLDQLARVRVRVRVRVTWSGLGLGLGLGLG